MITFPSFSYSFIVTWPSVLAASHSVLKKHAKSYKQPSLSARAPVITQLGQQHLLKIKFIFNYLLIILGGTEDMALKVVEQACSVLSAIEY